jgi:type II secretory pathway pseudopilin PulG
MARSRGRLNPRQQAGFALIEVVVSALIIAVTTGGVVKLLNSTGRAGAEERHKAQAYAIAQEDQSRMRAMRIPILLNAVKTPRQVTVGGTVYTVTSSASFINDVSENLGCGVGKSSDDFVKIASQVTWPTQDTGNTTKIQSIINPPGGSLDPSLGTLVFNATNAQGTPISAVGLTGTGSGTFTGSTDSTGCARFTDLPAGNYTLTTSLAGGYIDEDGNPPGARTITVVGAGSNTITILYDKAGTLEAKFDVRTSASSTAVAATKAEGIVVVNNGMLAQQRLFSSTSLQTSFKPTGLFPFKSPYAVYAGACMKEIPEEADVFSSALIEPSKTTVATVHLPALFPLVRKSTPTGGTANVTSGSIKVDDTECAANLLRTYTINSSGKPSESIGVPWGNYNVCASGPVTYKYSVYNSTKKQYETKEATETFREYKALDIKAIVGTSTEFFLTSEDEKGAC